MARFGVLLVVPLLVLACVRVLGAAVLPGVGVTVRVYNAAALDPAAAGRALETAAATLSVASVDVTWKRCPGAPTCDVPMHPRELAVRFVRVPVARDFQGSLPLGDALVDARAGAGVLATIYVDRVEWLAAASEHDVPTLLGRAVAHELGHLLLAHSTHSRHGLMRAHWSRHEIRLGRSADWVFTGPDIAAIQARLRGWPR